MAEAPPSTRSWVIVRPASDCIAGQIHVLQRDRLQRRPARCARVVPRVIPEMTPRASGRQCGAPSPTSAGTMVTPPESGTERASVSISGALAMMPSPSRSHCTSAPAMKALPSSAKAVVVRADPATSSVQATVVRSRASSARLRAHVHQQKRARPVGALGVARVEAVLSEQGRLLVARQPGDGNAVGQPVDAAGGGDHLRRAAHLGQDARGRRTVASSSVNRRLQVEQQRA